MGRRLRSPRLPGVDVPGVEASMSPRPQPRRAMRCADVYVCMLADGVALRNRCPQGQADPRAAIAGGAPGTLGSEPAGPMAERCLSLSWWWACEYVWLGWTLWRALRLDEALTRLLPEGREAVPWATMAAVLVLARLCEPSSELHIAETWYRGTALEDLLALPAPLVNDDRLYRALDRLVLHKTALERHLVARLGELFALDYDLLLYDVTSIYFEGVAEANPLARRGHSRDHRPDCKQVCLALVVTREGMPLGYEVFAGNRTDVTTVEEIVEAMEARYGLAQRIWVMDRGMTSEDNLEWLRQTGRRYLVGPPKSELKKWAGAIAEARDWQTVRAGREAKRCGRPDGGEAVVLTRAGERPG